MKCPVCNGIGAFVEDFGEGTVVSEPCGYCKGKGSLTLARWFGYYFWMYMPDWTWDVAYWIHENKSKRRK